MLFNLPGKIECSPRCRGNIGWKACCHGPFTLCAVLRAARGGFCQGCPLAPFMVLIDRISGCSRLVEGVSCGWLLSLALRFTADRVQLPLSNNDLQFTLGPSTAMWGGFLRKASGLSLTDGIRILAIWEALKEERLILSSWARSSIWLGGHLKGAREIPEADPGQEWGLGSVFYPTSTLEISQRVWRQVRSTVRCVSTISWGDAGHCPRIARASFRFLFPSFLRMFVSSSYLMQC